MLTRLLMLKGDKLTFVSKFGPYNYDSPIVTFCIEYFLLDINDIALNNNIPLVLYVDAITYKGTDIEIYSDRPDNSSISVREP